MLSAPAPHGQRAHSGCVAYIPVSDVCNSGETPNLAQRVGHPCRPGRGTRSGGGHRTPAADRSCSRSAGCGYLQRVRGPDRCRRPPPGRPRNRHRRQSRRRRVVRGRPPDRLLAVRPLRGDCRHAEYRGAAPDLGGRDLLRRARIRRQSGPRWASATPSTARTTTSSSSWTPSTTSGRRTPLW